MHGTVPVGYMRLSEVLDMVANAMKTAGAGTTNQELGNAVGCTIRVLNHMLRFRQVKRPIIIVDQAGEPVAITKIRRQVLVATFSRSPGLGEPEIFVHRPGFEEALEGDTQREGMPWPQSATIKTYLSFGELADLREQNEMSSSLRLPTEIRRSAVEGKLEVYGRRPTGGPLERIPQLHFVGTFVDDRHSRKASLANADGPMWVDLTFRRECARGLARVGFGNHTSAERVSKSRATSQFFDGRC